MSWNDSEEEDTRTYKVVVNHEEQYSIWPEYKENPPGWKEVGKTGPKEECLSYIKEIWTDMRPLSVRNRMAELAKNPPPLPPPPDPNRPREKSLVDKLCEGDHSVEVGLGPTRTVQTFKEAIDRNYIHIRFSNTKGGTELGVRLDRDACNLTNADFDAGKGTVHIEGGLSLDFVAVSCVADIDLETLAGKGHLEKVVENGSDSVQ
jgi:uncharacterized protein YbdZ (MbtH family)